MGLRFYDPNQTKAAPKAAAPASEIRGANPQRDKLGYLTVGQLNDPQWGFGTSFQAAARQGGLQELMNAKTSANPNDVAAQDQMRNFYTSSLAGLGEAGDRRGTAFDTQMQRGLSNLLNQYKRGRAGSGVIGSAQYDRGTGDVVGKLAEEYTRGVNDLGGQQLAQAGQIGQGLGNLYAQDVQDRQLQQQHAGNIAGWLSGQINADLGRDAGLAAARAGETSFMQDIAPLVGMGAGALIGGPVGAGIGGQVGSMAAGSKSSGGGNQSMGLAQMLQQQQMMSQLGGYGGGGGGGGYSSAPSGASSSYTGGNAPWWR